MNENYRDIKVGEEVRLSEEMKSRVKRRVPNLTPSEEEILDDTLIVKKDESKFGSLPFIDVLGHYFAFNKKGFYLVGDERPSIIPYSSSHTGVEKLAEGDVFICVKEDYKHFKIKEEVLIYDCGKGGLPSIKDRKGRLWLFKAKNDVFLEVKTLEGEAYFVKKGFCNGR